MIVPEVLLALVLVELGAVAEKAKKYSTPTGFEPAQHYASRSFECNGCTH